MKSPNSLDIARTALVDIEADQAALADSLRELDARYGEAKVREKLEALRHHGNAIDDPQLWLRVALAHDFKYMPIERVEECPCGSRESTLLCHFIFWNLLGLRQCHVCRLVFVSPRLARQAVSRLFNEFYFSDSGPEFWDRRRIPIFKDILRLLRRYGCRSVFDVGAAFGNFLAMATKEGIEAAGCDISEAAVKWGREKLGVNLYPGTLAELGLPANSVDCVVSLDTFYYVADPLAELRAMRRVVKPGGYVILRLRNSLLTVARAKHRGKKPVGRAVIPAQHLWALTPETAANLFRLCDFEVKACEPAAYSRTLLTPFDALVVQASRLLAGPRLRWPILTAGFNIVGQRKC